MVKFSISHDSCFLYILKSKICMYIRSLVIDDKSQHFKRKKGQPGFTQQSCIMLFYDSFYSRLFDIHPVGNISRTMKMIFYIIIYYCYI